MQSIKTSKFAVLSSPPCEIKGHHCIRDVMDWFPQTRIVFLANHLRAFATPVVRKVLGKVTVSQLCRIQVKNLPDFLMELNIAAGLSKTRSCEDCTGSRCSSEN